MHAPSKITPLALVLFLSLVACPEPPQNGGPDGGSDAGTNGEPPAILSISPTEGPVEGGTRVLISGERFEQGARVFFGGVEVDQAEVSVPSARRISAKAPQAGAPGSVSVKVVNPDGQATALLGAFTYRGASAGIAEARLHGDPVVRDSSGTSTFMHTVRSDVEVPGLTQIDGPALGVRAQVGWAEHSTSLELSALQWAEAGFEADVDGKTTGDHARDRYQGQVALPGATGGEVRVYAVAVRFSIDGGQTWVVADLDGSSNGATVAQLQRIELSRNRIDWCKLGGQTIEAPQSVSLEEGEIGPTIYAQLYEAGVTDAANAGSGIVAELGYGTRDSDPAAGGWTWTAAHFNVDTGSGANDEYKAVLPNPGAGAYAFAYRVQVGGGAWTYCDANGTGADSPFEMAQAGTLTVTSVATSPQCRLMRVTAPGSTAPLTTVASGAPVEALARVVIPGVTNPAGAASGVKVQVGVGSQGVNAAGDPNWGWKAATFDSDETVTGGELYRASFSPAYSGSRAVSIRYSTDNGQTWTYCDLDGSQNGYAESQQATLAVGTAEDIDYCVLQWPPTLPEPMSNPPSWMMYGRVYEAGVTDNANTDPAVAFDVEWGWGKKAEDPGLAWTWARAQYNVAVGNDDEFQAEFTGVPSGTWSYAFRFRKSGATSWCYADLDGNGANSGLTGFNGEKADASENLGQATLTP